MLCFLVFSGCRDTACKKLIAVSETCYDRYCVSGGAGTAMCACWEHGMVLGGWTAGSCNDGIDNNGNGLTDCEDPGCWDSEACNCNDGIDNNGNGLTDCEDPECAFSVHCEHVDWGLDDCCLGDEDGICEMDCNDPECRAHPSCLSVTTTWNSEKIPYCVDAGKVLDQSCHADAAEDLMEAFDCGKWIFLHMSGLPGKWNVKEWTTRVDLGRDGLINEEETLSDPLIEATGENGEVQPLKSITFFNDGWFASNISRGVWSLRTSRGKPTGKIAVHFLNDTCLENWRTCDTTRPTNWRRDSRNGIMFYEFIMMPQGSRYVLSEDPYLEDYNGDGIQDKVFQTFSLERLF